MARFTDKERVRHLIDDPQENRFLQLINALPKVAVQGYDKERRVIYWNQSSVELYGYQAHEALGKKLEELIIPEAMRDAVIAAHRNWIEHGIPIPASELVLMNKENAPVTVFSSHVMLRSDSDSPEMYCVDIDLSEQYAARAELERIARQDLLTQLPNRLQLKSELDVRINEAARKGTKLALLFIDLDMFKEVNDAQGHSYGDELLVAVADRLRTQVRCYDMLARFGGDEFVLLMPEVCSEQDVEVVANKLLCSFEQTFRVGDDQLYITASIGISLFPRDGEESDVLLRHADSAMYQAKEQGRNCYRFFDFELNNRLRGER
jgi:diguanylate cyclase (GGDEF)-like protein/PAS domain S-box-containing protein